MDTDHDRIDPERPRGGRPFDRADGTFGQEYHRDDEAAMQRDDPSGSVMGQRSTGDTGGRAAIDPITGEVRGSGMGAGGGQPGEDHDEDAGGGSGPPQTGRGSAGAGGPGRTGPSHSDPTVR